MFRKLRYRLHTVNNHFVPAGLFGVDSIFKWPLLPISRFSKHRSVLRSIRVIRVANCIFRMWIKRIVECPMWELLRIFESRRSRQLSSWFELSKHSSHFLQSVPQGWQVDNRMQAIAQLTDMIKTDKTPHGVRSSFTAVQKFLQDHITTSAC